LRNEDGNIVPTGSGPTIEAANLSSKVRVAIKCFEIANSSLSTIHVGGYCIFSLYFSGGTERASKSTRREYK